MWRKFFYQLENLFGFYTLFERTRNFEANNFCCSFALKLIRNQQVKRFLCQGGWSCYRVVGIFMNAMSYGLACCVGVLSRVFFSPSQRRWKNTRCIVLII